MIVLIPTELDSVSKYLILELDWLFRRALGQHTMVRHIYILPMHCEYELRTKTQISKILYVSLQHLKWETALSQTALSHFLCRKSPPEGHSLILAEYLPEHLFLISSYYWRFETLAVIVRWMYWCGSEKLWMRGMKHPLSAFWVSLTVDHFVVTEQPDKREWNDHISIVVICEMLIVTYQKSVSE